MVSVYFSGFGESVAPEDQALCPWEILGSCSTWKVCGRCRRDFEQPYLYSAANKMDPGPIPPQLPELTLAEEMLIARAHVQMDISRVRGCQYKYKGHVISWMQNIPNMVQRLPSLRKCATTVIILHPERRQ